MSTNARMDFCLSKQIWKILQQMCWFCLLYTSIARMNEGFFRECGLFLHSGKLPLLFGEGLTGFGKRLCLFIGLCGQAGQTLLLPLDFELGDGQVFFGTAAPCLDGWPPT